MPDRAKLIELYENYYGARVTPGQSDMELILDILAQLVKDAERQNEHTHDIR